MRPLKEAHLSVLYKSSYTVPVGAKSLDHARLAHSLNWFDGGTASASTTDSAYFADAPLNTLTYEFWKPTATASTWEYDHGSSVECDYCCIAAHTLGSNSATIKMQYYSGGWLDLTDSEALLDDSPVFAIFTPTTAQRWRVNITSATTIPKIGVVKFGTALQMQQPIFGGHAPVDLSRQTILRANYSETGENLGRSKQRTFLKTSFEWEHLTAAWTHANWPTVQLAIEDEPFWVAWRPSTYTEAGVGFCQTETVPIPLNMGISDKMSVSLDVRARGYE